MEYNKAGEITRYYNLDDILKLNLSDTFKEEIKKKLHRKVYYDNRGTCKVGTRIGIERNNKLLETYYIVDIDGDKNFVPIYKSITRIVD